MDLVEFNSALKKSTPQHTFRKITAIYPDMEKIASAVETLDNDLHLSGLGENRVCSADSRELLAFLQNLKISRRRWSLRRMIRTTPDFEKISSAVDFVENYLQLLRF